MTASLMLKTIKNKFISDEFGFHLFVCMCVTVSE